MQHSQSLQLLLLTDNITNYICTDRWLIDTTVPGLGKSLICFVLPQMIIHGACGWVGHRKAEESASMREIKQFDEPYSLCSFTNGLSYPQTPLKDGASLYLYYNITSFRKCRQYLVLTHHLVYGVFCTYYTII